MKMHNPFANVETVAGYEAWYRTDGCKADQQEKSILKWLLSGFPAAHSILEVGCGSGHFTRWFIEQGLRAVGLDLSHPMLEESKRLGSEFLLQGDALRLPILSKSFDLTALITTLEFLPNSVQALTEALRVARQGIILGVLNRQSCLGRKHKRSGGPIWKYARLFTPYELKQAILEAVGERVNIIWCTILWPLWPTSLPLPWGGFIGMSANQMREGELT